MFPAHSLPAYFRAIIEEFANRAVEEDIEGVPQWERFRVISFELGLFLYILARSSERQLIFEPDGEGGAASSLAWLAFGASEVGGQVYGWESNPRRRIKLINSLTRSRIAPSVRLGTIDPLWPGDGVVLAPPEFEDGAPDHEQILSGPKFDCVLISALETDWKRRVEFAWEFLDDEGLFLLTDTYLAGNECQKFLSEFFPGKTAGVVGIPLEEGLVLAYKFSEPSEGEGNFVDSLPVEPDIAKVLEFLEGENRKPGRHLMAIPRETGLFLHILARALKARHVLEIGTGSGYSGTWIASALASHGGDMITMDSDPVKIVLAKETFEKAGMTDRIELIEGDA
ncbi:MAG: class I SAM-dependent methyltransferase, partial [bacterium]